MSQAATKKKKRLGREELTLNLMILPGLIILIIFRVCTASWFADGI